MSGSHSALAVNAQREGGMCMHTYINTYVHTYMQVCQTRIFDYVCMYVCMYVGEAEYVSMQQELLQLSRRLQDEVAPCGKRVCMYVYGHKALPVVFAGLSARFLFT